MKDEEMLKASLPKSPCWGCGCSSDFLCLGCACPCCKKCTSSQFCVSCQLDGEADEVIVDPELDEPLQRQQVLPLKAGTSKLLESGRNIAFASLKHNLSRRTVRDCLITDSTSAAVDQARHASRSKGSSIALHEYCFSEGSLIGKETVRRDIRIRRWGLHSCDLAQPSGVQRVVDQIRRDLKSGLDVVLWASLPCTAWCTWHRIRMSKDELFRKSILNQRKDSLRMIDLFRQVLSVLKREP